MNIPWTKEQLMKANQKLIDTNKELKEKLEKLISSSVKGE